MDRKPPPRSLVHAALLAVPVLYGVSNVVSKEILRAVPALLWAAGRLLVAAALMILVGLVLRRPLPRGGRAFHLPVLLWSGLGVILSQGAFLYGLQFTSATHASILNTLIPVITLVIVTLRRQEPLTRRRLAGFLLAFGGVLALKYRDLHSLSFAGDRGLFGDALILFNGLCVAMFFSYSKPFLERNDRFWVTTFIFAYGGLGMTALASPAWIGAQPPVVTPVLIGCMAFAILGGTMAAYFINVWALANARVTSVAIFNYMQPVAAASFAWAWRGERVSLHTFASSLLIFAGVLVATHRPDAPATKDEAPASSPSSRAPAG